MNEYQAFFAMVKNWTVSDYNTQNIRSEVIIDMLISDFIGEIAAAKLSEFDDTITLDDITFLAKEFPIDNGLPGLNNAKVDFLVGCKDKLYLTELKTTEDSHSPTQKDRMIIAANDGVHNMLDFFFKIIAQKRAKTYEEDSKKYLFTLKSMKEKFYKDDKSGDVSDEKFKQDLNEKYSNIEIIYIELNKPKNSEFLKTKDNKIIESIVLSELDSSDNFKALLSEEKKLKWSLVSQIIKEIKTIF